MQWNNNCIFFHYNMLVRKTQITKYCYFAFIDQDQGLLKNFYYSLKNIDYFISMCKERRILFLI